MPQRYPLWCVLFTFGAVLARSGASRGTLVFDLSCARWSLCEWSRDRNSTNMGLNRTQCVMWAIGSTAITAIQLQCQDSLIRGLSGEHRTGYAVKQCEICSLTKCCGRALCLSSPSTVGFGKDPQQRWVMESDRPSGRNSPQSFTQVCGQLQQCMDKSHQRQHFNLLCQWFMCFPCLQVSRSTTGCNTALLSDTPAASWPLISMALWPVWSAWRPSSVSASVHQPREFLKTLGFH